MSIIKGLRAATARSPTVSKSVTVGSLTASGGLAVGEDPQSAARKLSAVDRCIELLSDSIAKLPNYVIDTRTRERTDHELLRLLNIRPNEAMTPFIRKKVPTPAPFSTLACSWSRYTSVPSSRHAALIATALLSTALIGFLARSRQLSTRGSTRGAMSAASFDFSSPASQDRPDAGLDRALRRVVLAGLALVLLVVRLKKLLLLLLVVH